MKKLTEREKQALKELKEGLKKLYGDNLSRLILYGSKAREDATEDSDIDVMVILKEEFDYLKERKRVNDILWQICYKYDLLIGAVIEKESDYVSVNSPLVKNVIREGIAL